ncbi:phenylacetate--CoA ligase family protein [Pseudomonas chlororaphis]|uniref:phenylacetate--CoA ligase family protein n=1 Tax=Pseudomonas chlororaphis TaxID=587753 RepID=UPI0006A62BCB|nr:phenylacetate--CoA ligase family protein [Pseudomonas chlororaphis]AZD02458.1 Coenzyme F390 synthetase [Pseudomonas chlororaphis subsp. chlororaphis]MBM0280509.1 phenylacetate--CoA ligase family protein [Pseudomonas chlororaphis]MDO1504851.1 phenylacetate--CoA ligase family protein [Pseudomonas chlororaphis]ORM44398.1 CoF synthetase [Pseudomonas chlororaphis subsp. chlororaphis]TWR95976.1 phenylacetate--CoA ligase family protein [Pseudomonas chlororaphis subsp. chlororaphis]
MIKDNLHRQWLEDVDAYLDGRTTPQELEAKGQLRAREVLQYVQERSTFYARHLRSQLGGPSALPALDGIPFTTKEDLRAVGRSVCSLPFEQIAVYYETTGTTGAPTPCPRAAIDVDTSGAYVQKAVSDLYQSTFGTTDALTAIMGPSELYAFGDTYGEVCRNLGIPYVRLWPESPRVGLVKAAQLINDLGVRSLICSPAVALALARLYVSQGIDPRATAVGQIMVLGELCTPQMLSNIARVWNAHCTHGLYGSQEAHAVATGCANGNLHFSETNYLAEILPVPGMEGDIGELCLTMLVPGAKPLIRYRTGDLARLHAAEECGCGNRSRCLRVFGRVSDVMTLAGRQVLPALIESAVLAAAEWVSGYEVRICTASDGSDHVEVSMVAGIGERSLAQVQEQMAGHFGTSVQLQLEQSLDPRTETGAYISWKHARIRDQRESAL